MNNQKDKGRVLVDRWDRISRGLYRPGVDRKGMAGKSPPPRQRAAGLYSARGLGESGMGQRRCSRCRRAGGNDGRRRCRRPFGGKTLFFPVATATRCITRISKARPTSSIRRWNRIFAGSSMSVRWLRWAGAGNGEDPSTRKKAGVKPSGIPGMPPANFTARWKSGGGWVKGYPA